MRELRDILKGLADLRARREPAALATITQVKGSTYRREGARLLIRQDGTTVGSLSGGCLEGDVAEAAVFALRSPAEDVEGLVRGAILPRHQHPLGLVPDECSPVGVRHSRDQLGGNHAKHSSRPIIEPADQGDLGTEEEEDAIRKVGRDLAGTARSGGLVRRRRVITGLHHNL